MPAPFYAGQPDYITQLNNLFSVSATYYGPLAADPSTRPDGSARQVGDRYYNTTAGQERTWSGSNWSPTNLVAAQLAAAGGGALVGNTPAGGISATTVQAAINELDAEKATPAQITAAINALVAAAPGVLDTLDKLAAALGDDPNFAATMTAALAAKATIAAVQAGTNTEAVGTGTADAILGAYTPAITSLTNGLELRVRTPGANTITAPTFKADGTTLKAIVKGNGVALAAADAQGWLTLRYDSTLDKWVLLNPATPAVQPPTGFQSFIINGDMCIDQEHAGTATTVAANSAWAYPVDQWAVLNTRTNGSTLVCQQIAPLAPGYRNALRIVNTTTGASAAGDFIALVQPIIGNNLAGLMWGTATALPVRLKFVLYCTVAGNYCLSLRNGANTRSYCHLVNLAASTLTVISLTVPGDTGGTWTTGSSAGLFVGFDLGCGSTYQTATLDAWQAGNFAAATTGTKLSGTAGAQFILTGVDGRPGSQDAPSEQRPVPIELGLCKEYFRKTFPQSVAVANNAGTAGAIFLGGQNALGYHSKRWEHGPMRAAPVYTAYNPGPGAALSWRDVASSTDSLAGYIANGGDSSVEVALNSANVTTPASGSAWYVHLVANARML
jgi:hypothetical protein